MRLLTWNVEWASGCSRRGQAIQAIVEGRAPDVLCYTEAVVNMRPAVGHVISAEADYGYEHDGTRRKVLMWSREPWTDVDDHGGAGMPSGRFITGITQGIRMIGVCIPWRDAHVRTGRRDRRAWEDHLAYLAGLRARVERYIEAGERVCLTGDFNQRIPRLGQPQAVWRGLASVFDSGLDVVTAGTTDGVGKHLIDHVAVGPGLRGEVKEVVSNVTHGGVQLSDHVGIVSSVEHRETVGR